MSYQPPAFDCLIANTATPKDGKSNDNYKLLQSISHVANRYIPPDYSTLYYALDGDKLSELYKSKLKQKTGYFTNTKPSKARIDQIQFIKQIHAKLTKPKPNEDKKPKITDSTHSKDHFILLGALFHRIERTDTNYRDNFSFYSSDSSGLTQAILEITKIMAKNQLDPLTKLTCYKEYLIFLKENTFEYVRQKPEFYKELSQQITELENETKPLQFQINMIKFIKSVTDTVSVYLPRMLTAVENLKTPLRKALLKADQSGKILTSHLILNCLEGQGLKDWLSRLIFKKDRLGKAVITSYDDEIDDEFEDDYCAEEDLADYIKCLSDRMKRYCLYGILGAYGMCLIRIAKLHGSDSKLPLITVLNAAINSENNAFIKDNVELRRALSALDILIKNFGDDLVGNIDFSSWDNFDLFNKELNSYCTALESGHSPLETAETKMALGL